MPVRFIFVRFSTDRLSCPLMAIEKNPGLDRQSIHAFKLFDVP
jgi:hypothetical protein